MCDIWIQKCLQDRKERQCEEEVPMSTILRFMLLQIVQLIYRDELQEPAQTGYSTPLTIMTRTTPRNSRGRAFFTALRIFGVVEEVRYDGSFRIGKADTTP